MNIYKKISVVLFVFGLLIFNTNNLNAQTTTSISQPSISIVYPAGGETFKPGDNVTIKWISTNIPADGDIDIVLMADPHQTKILDKYKGCIGGSWDDCIKAHQKGDRFLNTMEVVTKNTGSVSFTIPNKYIPTAKYSFYIEYFSNTIDSSGRITNHTTYTTGLGSRKNLFNIVSDSDLSIVKVKENNSKTSEQVKQAVSLDSSISEKQFPVQDGNSDINPKPIQAAPENVVTMKPSLLKRVSNFFTQFKFW